MNKTSVHYKEHYSVAKAKEEKLPAAMQGMKAF
jgi:hypothetical protein